MDVAGSGPIGISVEGQLDRILTEIAEVRVEIVKFRERDPAADRERDRNALWAGIETIQDAIRNTKKEIATLHAEGTRGESLFRATDELDAVVQDTEEATEAILSSAETIDSAVSILIGRLSGEELTLAEEIQAQTIKTFEACNFQDITGQRIKKVVKLLTFIEERVARMTDIWGGAEMVAENAGIITREGDEALLNGPALAHDENVVSQDDIDSLFA
ncbi:protein phosphatase CheZ [Azorhizobium doebereinerae]|uniref:protein phosphatase CheZ n=1 Tax=Azorhizobium doebereinerae TaxID=281091 RepID=UPI00054FF8C9|nr:protein phosphatase CheZ [Azorhizobium doebereinerae]